MDADKVAVLSVLDAFLEAVSSPNKPPWRHAYEVIIGDGFQAQYSPGDTEPEFLTLREGIIRLESLVARKGPTPVATIHRAPAPEMWLHGDIAAVLMGYSTTLDGKDYEIGIDAVSFIKTAAAGWKISGITRYALAPGSELPPVVKDEAPQLVSPIDAGLAPLKNRAWDEVGEGLIPYSGGGYTNVRPPNILNLRRPAFIERLNVFGETMEKDIVMEEPLYDIEVRACGDLGFVWAPFMLTVNGGVASRGASIYTLFRVDGNWKIAAGQDTHWQPQNS